MLNTMKATNQVGRKLTQQNNMNTRFLASAGDNTPVILCEEHAKVFEMIMMANELPHTIYELDEEDAEETKCHACDLQDELTRPRIILPN